MAEAAGSITREASASPASDSTADSTTEIQADESPVFVPQVDDSIDFASLYNSTDDETLRSLSAYFSGVTPTYNSYTVQDIS